jgi:hypothetical protein
MVSSSGSIRAEAEQFQALRAKMEAEWTPQMMRLLEIDVGSLPII